ncbi:MAG: hypothetical protein IJP13_03535 [Lachnospiraceae bacterium]|nr:hypothetical protein [Lachnospiraceae bacterium]
MESETQKNWNNYFNNTKKKSSNTPWIFIVFMIICIGSAITYAFLNNEPIVDDNNDNNVIDINVSNRTGIVMANSVHTIENIIDNIDTKSEAELQDCIAVVEELPLSSEYNELKNIIIDKINLYIEYKKQGTPEALNAYNDVKWLAELAKVFDVVGITYYINDDNSKIEFEYIQE